MPRRVVPTANGHLSDKDRAVRDLVDNAMLARTEFLRQFMDPRRDYDDECGYPKGATGFFTSEQYEELYEREPVATRVVQLFPKECWQVTPDIESDDKAFMDAWAELCKSLNPNSHYDDDKGAAVWEYLYRGDMLSGIGSFGILLYGFDDGKLLQEPVAGVNPDGMPKDITGVAGTGLAEVGKDIYGGALSSTVGTDAQYAGTQFSPEAPSGDASEIKLLFVRAFAQYLVQIVQYEADVRNPRFGHPVMYLVTLNDPRQQHTGVGLPLATVRVHWSRVLHLADELQSSEVFGVPRMRPVLNRLLDLRKLYGGGAEGYWKSCFAALSLETHPQLGGDVIIDQDKMRDMMENYMNGLQRFLALTGMSAKTLAPSVVDPSGQIEKQIEAICIVLGCPVRVFKGSERGELASSQDDQAWNDRVRHRQNLYVTPRIVTPFVDRLIAVGVLPEPKGGYRVRWPDLEALSRSAKATIALSMTQALAAYVSGGVEQLIPPQDYLVRVLEMDEEDAEQMLQDASKAHDQGDTMTTPSADEEEQQRQDKLDALKQAKQGEPVDA